MAVSVVVVVLIIKFSLPLSGLLPFSWTPQWARPQTLTQAKHGDQDVTENELKEM